MAKSAVQRFIEEHMDNDSLAALIILEEAVGIKNNTPKKNRKNSLRAVNRFIKDNLQSNSVALAILENKTGLSLKYGKSGRPKTNHYTEFIWYLYIWDLVNNKNMAIEDAIKQYKNSSHHMKSQNPERNVIINRKNYSRWAKENSDLLKEDNTIIINNLDNILTYIKSCAIRGIDI